MPERLYSTKNAAHVLDVSPDDIVMLCNRRLLHGVKQGRFWKVSLRALRDFKKKYEYTPGAGWNRK